LTSSVHVGTLAWWLPPSLVIEWDEAKDTAANANRVLTDFTSATNGCVNPMPTAKPEGIWGCCQARCWLLVSSGSVAGDRTIGSGQLAGLVRWWPAWRL
jgi:hypothetical protein